MIMLDPQLIEKLKKNTQEINRLKSEIESSFAQENSISFSESESVELGDAIGVIVSKIRGLISKTRRVSSEQSVESMAFVEACLSRGDASSAVTLLKRMSKRGNIAPQVKLAEIYCYGVYPSGDFKNEKQGLKIYEHALLSGSSEAAVGLGLFFKKKDMVEKSIMFFEKAYGMGNQKVYPELVVMYKKQLVAVEDDSSRLRISQKLNNIKSELILK